MTRSGAALALAATAVATAIAIAPARSAPAAGPLALVRGPDRETVLVRLEPRTLQPAGKRVRLDRHTGAWSFSPDRRTLVLGQTSKATLGNPASVRFVDVTRMRVLGDVELPAELGRVSETAWLSPARLVVLVERCCPETTRLLLVDVVRRRIVGRRQIAGDVIGGGRMSGALVLLSAPHQRIGPLRVVVARARLRVSSLEVSRVTGGTAFVGEGEQRRVRERRPGFALDPQRGRAFVLGRGEPVAEVDLRSHRVSYQKFAVPALAAAKKSIEGPWLSAEWLGGGRIAVAGLDYRGDRAEPLGLQVVDTRDWSAIDVDRRSSGFRYAAGTPAPNGLVGYGVDGKRRFDLPLPANLHRLAVFGAEAHVALDDRSRRVVVVDVRSGRVLRRYGGPAEESWPYLLAGAAKPIW